MKSIQHALNTRIFIRTTVKYIRKKIEKRLETDQFDDEQTNQNNEKKLFNEKFNAEIQLNRRSLSESNNDNDDI